MTEQERIAEKAHLFLYFFKAEDIHMPKDTSRWDLAISGECPFAMDEELRSALRGQNWGSYSVVGVEAFAHMPPWRMGESISLALKKEGR